MALPGALWFKIEQRCQVGEWRWVETPPEGTSTRGAWAPAALLKVLPKVDAQACAEEVIQAAGCAGPAARWHAGHHWPRRSAPHPSLKPAAPAFKPLQRPAGGTCPPESCSWKAASAVGDGQILPPGDYHDFTSRHIEHVQQGVATQDGNPASKLTRVLTQNLQMRLDPFLMLDAFGSDQRDDYIAGPRIRTEASRP